MPSKKTRTKQRVSDHDDKLTGVDIQYNPDIVEGLLQDLEAQVESKCSQIKKDVDFMSTSIQQSFRLELIKLPGQVKNMTLKRFKEEYGDSLEAVTRGAMGGQPGFATATKPLNPNNSVFQTPSSNRAPGVQARHPKEGEQILSKNGSPLGEFNTVVKAPKAGNSIIPPPTPGCYVQSKSGDVIDVTTISEANISELSEEMKQDALTKMKMMMSDMQSIMNKMQGSSQPAAL
eukprot:CAMPEP_0114422824 /NCGR_PEP_ID=MMETSP0103-20121206/5816_1 /TAXON_ID=37642 ORGANISM="Paraphysomonas imperforata, Strain PA2" /NCGR_SAMPLE_ID=MMETSP0103 /ASSEMBLY_ACC=CAM_ASM_000201 /LENGTH=231 /DNA_ID=CAMNT_0001591435 /DNA_START=53 /DNA_END=748 /DNA_ORIENTATION=+